MTEPALIQLRKAEDRRVRLGPPWVYSNQIDTRVTPLSAIEVGQTVRVVDSAGRPLGVGYANPHALICVRLMAAGAADFPDQAEIVARIGAALRLRKRLYPRGSFRWIFGESDDLPGLVVDHLGPVLIAQIATAGMERLKDGVASALQHWAPGVPLLWKNDGSARQLEALPEYQQWQDDVALDACWIEEDGLAFRIEPSSAQKTGWFLDQRDNRRLIAAHAAGARVLDVFCYGGGWGLRALSHGAVSLTAVDTSAQALSGLQQSAERQGVLDRVRCLQGDAFEHLRALRSEVPFDLVIADPPAFAKRRKDRDAGLLAYRRLAEAALRCTADGGILVFCSCSFHVSHEELLDALRRAAHASTKRLRLLTRLQQSADHPVHPAIPESAYLKGVIAEVRCN